MQLVGTEPMFCLLPWIATSLQGNHKPDLHAICTALNQLSLSPHIPGRIKQFHFASTVKQE